MSYPFSRLDASVVAHTLCPFLTYSDVVCFFNTSKGGRSIREIVERQMFSRIPIFGKDCYQRFWGVEITDRFEPQKIDIRILRTFLKTYYGPNPVDPTKGVKSTCLFPTVIPKWMIVEGRGFDFNLNLLEDIASHPRIGENNASKYWDNPEDLEPIGENSLQEAHLAIILVGVIGRGDSWEAQVQRLRDLNERTKYGCETEPDVLSITTAAFAVNAVRAERPFGDQTGLERRDTYSRTKELVQWRQFKCHIMVGNFMKDHLGRPGPWGPLGPFGRYGPSELFISRNCFCDTKAIGVAVQRNFG